MTRLSKALGGNELKEALKGVHILGIRSRTQITQDVLDAADRLIAIGCFSVGTNQVDIDAARRSGIPVFNAPFSEYALSCRALVIGGDRHAVPPDHPRAPTWRMKAVGRNRPITAMRCAARRTVSLATEALTRITLEPGGSAGHARDLL